MRQWQERLRREKAGSGIAGIRAPQAKTAGLRTVYSLLRSWSLDRLNEHPNGGGYVAIEKCDDDIARVLLERKNDSGIFRAVFRLHVTLEASVEAPGRRCRERHP